MNEPTAQPAAPELEFLTVKQTAKYLNRSVSIVYQLTNQHVRTLGS